MNSGLVGAGALAMTALASPQQAEAGAFQLNERSTRSQGMSFADSVSGAKDPTYAGFNPAALSKTEYLAAGGNLSFVVPIANGETTTAVIGGAEAPIAALPAGIDPNTDADRSAIVPAFAVGYRVADDFVLGFSSKSPFGLVTQNQTNFIGAVDGVTSKLTAIEFSPAISWEATNKFAIGGSLNILYVDARLTSLPVALDGDTVDVSFSVGALWEPVDGTRVGLAYQHGYDIIVPAETTFRAAAGLPPAVTGVRLEGDVSADLPPTIQFGITQDITDDIRVSVEARGIFWSDFDAITTEVDSIGFAVDDPQNYENAFFVAVGGEYDVNEELTVRGGIAYDDSPTVDTTSLADEDLGRTVRVPDANRIWFSAGASYDMDLFGYDTTLDFAYSYLFGVNDPDVVIRAGPFAGSVVEYDANAHIVSLGGSVRF